MASVDERRAGFKRYKEDVAGRGKPFYPYAMFHDTVMSLVVVSVIAGLAIVWRHSDILGPFLADFLRGGAEIGNDTLSRFYSLHMLLIPGLIFALIGLHLYLVVRLGVSSPPWSREAAGGGDYPAAPPSTNGRSGLTQPTARSGWRRNGGES